ncbi:MICOS complex subunit MIC27 isoform X2 [Schistocerca gregaria]|uniref:MICOS complex subunit MIC27 isoform X2 n=1 Tax=Schistocerca gregaria TaxID=7010 RepID=UPI00211DBFAB|nr:MICOS complex subunit MIC27 isoform X2 [Schistocerca gregaria]
MIRFQILKKFVIPTSLAAAVIKSESGKDSTEAKPCRPSELPLYEDDSCGCRPKRKGGAHLGALEQQTSSALEEQIRVIRKELWVWHDQYKGYRDKLVEKIEVAKAHSESTLAFLKEEGNYLPRIGAISLGGLTGVIFGLRGGWFRRLTYGAAGSLAMSALCYPRQASEVSQEALTYAKKYVAVTYNFIYGVKPENTQSSNPMAGDLKHSSDAPPVTAQKDTQKKNLQSQ